MNDAEKGYGYILPEKGTKVAYILLTDSAAVVAADNYISRRNDGSRISNNKNKQEKEYSRTVGRWTQGWREGWAGMVERQRN